MCIENKCETLIINMKSEHFIFTHLNQHRANKIGEAGKQLCVEKFDYISYGKELSEFLLA